jgi:hypothetical protein
MLGPVQVLVVDVADPDQAGTVLASLAALGPLAESPADAPVRCVDAFECTIDDDGELVVITRDGRQPPSVPLFAEEVERAGPRVAAEELWDLSEVVPPGGRVVVAVLEHRWAVGLRDALLAAGAALRYETWLDAEDRAGLEALIDEPEA